MDWPSVRSPVRSERVSLPPRQIAHRRSHALKLTAMVLGVFPFLLVLVNGLVIMPPQGAFSYETG